MCPGRRRATLLTSNGDRYQPSSIRIFAPWRAGRRAGNQSKSRSPGQVEVVSWENQTSDAACRCRGHAAVILARREAEQRPQRRTASPPDQGVAAWRRLRVDGVESRSDPPPSRTHKGVKDSKTTVPGGHLADHACTAPTTMRGWRQHQDPYIRPTERRRLEHGVCGPSSSTVGGILKPVQRS
jgi:hypothetical protein